MDPKRTMAEKFKNCNKDCSQTLKSHIFDNISTHSILPTCQDNPNGNLVTTQDNEVQLKTEDNMKERNRRVLYSDLNPNSPLPDIPPSNSQEDVIRTPNEQILTRPQKPKVV